MVDRYDVLIAGAGPTGLVLALWLARQGVKVALVDKAAQPGTTSRAMAVQARTLELYRQLGLADETIAAGKRNIALNMWVRGKRRARLSFQDAGEKLTPFSRCEPSHSRCGHVFLHNDQSPPAFMSVPLSSSQTISKWASLRSFK